MNDDQNTSNWFTEQRWFDVGPVYFFLDGLDCWCMGWLAGDHCEMMWLRWHWKP